MSQRTHQIAAAHLQRVQHQIRHHARTVHHHVRHHAKTLPARVAAVNEWLALHITNAVGSMWAAYLFALLAIAGFPGFGASPAQYVQWLSQTFIQLVCLSIIIVGQNIQSRASEKHQALVTTRMERMEREHGEELRVLHALVADLHSHTTCVGHTTIGEGERGNP